MFTDRPKCIRYVPIKMPDELYCDLQTQAARETEALRRRNPTAPEKTISDVIRDCCEFRLTLLVGLGLGYYQLRKLMRRETTVNG